LGVIAPSIFLTVCLLVGGKYHRSTFDWESGLQAVAFGALVLVGIYAIIEVVTIIRWNLRGGGPPGSRRRTWHSN
jgi:hypothetical protein